MSKNIVISELVYNIGYALWIHDDMGYTLGPESMADGGDRKWLARHVAADGKAYMEELKNNIAKGMNKLK